MKNSSDWIETAGTAGAAEPAEAHSGVNWWDAMGESAGFIDQFPHGAAAGARANHAANPDAVPTALEQAFADGEQAGRRAAQAQLDAQNEHVRQLRLSFRELDQAALDTLAMALQETVLALCEQAMAPYAVDEEALRDRCAKAAVRLGSAASDCKLRLHPQDISLLGEDFADQWQVEPDETIQRGGLRLESADGEVRDGPQEWRRAIAAALGS
ncbi:MAG: FliH/SctL family protein [Erythrobacter sp.]